MKFWYFLVGFSCLIAAIDLISGEENWNLGCYEIVSKNATHDAVNASSNSPLFCPGHCTYQCSNKRFKYAAMSPEDVCLCKKDLLGLQRLDESRCDHRCNSTVSNSCGGNNAVSVYSTLWPILFNVSMTGKTSLSSNDSSEFQGAAWLTSTANSSAENQDKNTRNSTKVANYISIVWSIDNLVYKRVNKTAYGREIVDSFNHWFHDHGLHNVCFNITNYWSVVSKCSPVWVLEQVHSLEVIGINGGQHTTGGLYAIAEAENIHLDVVVNAGSFADIHFDFGDGSGTSAVERKHTKTKKNCSCLALLKKTHKFKRKGLFSLNITAFNSIARKELVFKDIFTVDGRITGGSLRTNVAIAGVRSKVHVMPFGQFRYVFYQWELAGEIRKTADSFVYVDFPNNVAQYPVKVSIFNNVSKVDIEGIVYMQPKINSVSLIAQPIIATVGKVVRFTANAHVNYVPWNARENYIWQPGDGSSLHGTLSAAIYKYKRYGNFKARVTAKNLANSAVSDYINIQVYEVIQKLDAWYQPFHFGQPTVFFASIERGSNVTFFWNFGDLTQLNTTSRSVQYTYQKSGNYTFTVTAKNLVSQETFSSIIFVIGFECVAPRVSLTFGSYEQNIALSSGIRLEVDVSVNCSVSRKVTYRWKVFHVTNGRKLDKQHNGLGIRASVLNQRTLIIPPFSMKYGKYEFVLKVQIKDTIVYSEVTKVINIISTGLHAIIKGGNEKIIGRKSHENITLDASASYDPDSKDSNGLTFLWKCRSITDTQYSSCFKPNMTDGFTWTQPIIKFLPKILVNSAKTFAFTVTVSKPGFTKVTATQFLVLDNGPLYNLDVQCSDCYNIDVNSHKVIQFNADCKQCDDNVSFEWKIFFVTKQKVFFRNFGKCISPDGSDWKDVANANHTNTTQITTTSLSSSTVHIVTSAKPVTATTNPTVIVVNDQQRIICVKDLDKLRKNFTKLRYNGLSSSSTSYGSVRKRRNVDGSQLRGDMWLEDEMDESNNENIDSDHDNQWSQLNSATDANGDVIDQYVSYRVDEEEENNRRRRNIQQNMSQASDTQNSTTPTMNTPVISAQINPPTENITGSVSGITDDGSSGYNGDIGSASTGTGLQGANNRRDGFFQWTGSGGSGRAPNARGSGAGCDYGTGIGTGRFSGSGSGGISGGCTGNEDRFGEGAKNQKNQTKTDGSSGTVDTNAHYDKKLKKKLSTYRQIMNPARISVAQTSGITSKKFSIKKNTFVPGQFYMVQLTASWKTESGKKLAGQSKTFFTTNTGPFLGSCEVSPLIGYEIHTNFKLTCSHWKDKHFPLKQTVQYRRKTEDALSYIYSGYQTKLNFILPAGESTNNFTIALHVTIEDTEGVKTSLCPINLQVLPDTENQATLEERIYNGTFKNDSILKLYEDLSDINSAMVLTLSYASSLNRLSLVTFTSSKLQVRSLIRKGILSSLEQFRIQDEELTHQVVTLIRETTKIFQEVSLYSVQLSTRLIKRWVLQRMSKALSMELLTEVFEVTSNLLAATRHLNIRGLTSRNLKNAVLDILRIHNDVFSAKQARKNHSLSSQSLETNVLSTKISYYTENIQGIISIAGCSFTLPSIMPVFVPILNTVSTGIVSRMTVFESNPFTWVRDSPRIDSKVASLVFENSTGHEIKISDLTEPVVIKIPLLKNTQIKKSSHVINIFQLKIHGFNVTRGSDSSALFIHLQEIDAGDSSEHYQLQAVLRFDKPPNKVTFNSTLTFKNKTARLNFSPVPDVSKIYVGVFIKPLGRETIKKQDLPWFRYNLTIYYGSCLFWDSEKEIWSGNGCKASNASQMSNLICRCNHLTSFGGHIESISSLVEVKSLLNIKKNDDHHLVLILVLISMAVYLLLTIYFAKIERNIKSKKRIVNLPDNHAADSFRYLIIIETGCCKGAGTSARVSIVIHGQEGYSQIRELTCNGEEMFKRGATDCVMISFPDSLGEIRKIRLWHDNGGDTPAWFMKQITIVDCQNENSWYFHLNDWLRIGESTRVDCELPARKTPLISVTQIMCEGILDYHLWLSIFTRPNRSNFKSLERLTCCFASLLGYMCVLSSNLQRSFLQGREIHGLWDFGWSSVYMSLIATVIVMPVQMVFGFIMRNSGKSDNCFKNEEIDKQGKEETVEGSGALYFLNMLSAKQSSEACDVNETDKSLGPNITSIGNSEFILPSWCTMLCMAICILTASASAAVTILFGMSFNNQKMFLYLQSIIVCLSFNVFATETFLAIVTSIQRIYCLYKKADVETYLRAFRTSDSGGSQRDTFYNAHEVNEKKIMAARDRARFVRFSKPLSGDKLKKAERKVIGFKDLYWFLRELTLLIVYFITLSTILYDVKISDNYQLQSSVREIITRPSLHGGFSFGNVSSANEFWNWTESRLMDIVRWDCWEHLNSVLHSNRNKKDKVIELPVIYTFGPVRLWKEEHRPTEYNRLRNSSTVQDIETELLLVGRRETMLSTLQHLRKNDWTGKGTKQVHIDISYYHPEDDEFSFVQLSVTIPEYGKFMNSMNIDILRLHYNVNTWLIWTSICKVVFLLCVLLSLRNEFCSLMDKGLSHLSNFWSLVEASLIIISSLGSVMIVLHSVQIQKLLYRSHTMYLNDTRLFLDLGSLVLLQKMLRIVYASLLFIVMLKTLNFLRVWNRFADILEFTKHATSKLVSYFVAVLVIIAALTHSGRLLLGCTTWHFSETQTAITTLFSLLRRKAQLVDGDSDDFWLFRLYKVIAIIAVLILWRLSFVFYLGSFTASKLVGKRKLTIIKTLSKRLKKLKRKQLKNLMKNVTPKFWKKREEKYRINDLPLENVFEEIEYQVEEVVFRMNNLFNMQHMPNDGSNDYDGDTIDSSDDAAYPSSYSTKDNISYASESIYSEDSGYNRYGMSNDKWQSIYESEEEYEGPVIHRLDGPKQRLSDSGQFLSPIFGGRYFVKTSWSTFRAPKIQPGSIECKPSAIIRPQKSNSSQTFEKLNQWSSRHSAVNTTDVPLEVTSYENSGFENQENKVHENSEDTLQELGPTRIKLPRALDSIYRDFPRDQNVVRDPFKRPPKLPSITNVIAKNRKRRSFKKMQVSPMEADSCSYSSSNRSIGSDFHLPSRSPSLDSGIIRSSETEESESSEMSNSNKCHITDMFEVNQHHRFGSKTLDAKHCW